MAARSPVVFQGRAAVSVKKLHPITVRSYPQLAVGLVPNLASLLKSCAGTVKTTGALNVYVPAGGVSFNENCDATVRSDMLEGLRRVAAGVLHDAPGGDAAPPLDAVYDIVGRSATVPLAGGAPTLGTWQGLYLFFDSAAEEVEVILTVVEGAVKSFKCSANARASHDITPDVQATADHMTVVHTHHTSASLSLRDRAAAPADLEPIAEAIIPFAWNDEFFEHTYEGPDDMPGHMKSTVLGCGCVVDAALAGTKAVVLNEHRDVGGYGCGHTRTITTAHVPVAERRGVAVAASPTIVDVTAEVRKVADAGNAKLLYITAPSGGQVFLTARAAAAEQYFARAVRGVPFGTTVLPHCLLIPAAALERHAVRLNTMGAPQELSVAAL
eukprot:TRINITY_DN7920_c0_g1_i1.p1 TRINITY_DN7920_c0_g1~~TRINITY_DN7920_c0_g1_i1.p1  ORF type:complete len:384 (+),score=118.08 TRINITY_DN7920_c0_g1_i1:187-1338(+)